MILITSDEGEDRSMVLNLEQRTPKAFVSFAYADKPFVEQLARDLLARGVDIWASFWEIQPGDSLVTKIFEEGIGRADAVIVILSETSVTRPWVREELSVAKVREIEEKIRLIPVVIDGCTLPVSLRATLQERIIDGAGYDEGVKRIVATLYGQHEKPTLGPAPTFAQRTSVVLPGASNLENRVMSTACAMVAESGQEYISLIDLRTRAELADLGQQDVTDALDYLEDRARIDHCMRTQGNAEITYFHVTVSGFYSYASAGGVRDFGAIITQVAGALNERDRNGTMSDELGLELGHPEIVVRQILKWLAQQRCIIMLEGNAQGRVKVVGVQPALRRLLRGT